MMPFGEIKVSHTQLNYSSSEESSESGGLSSGKSSYVFSGGSGSMTGCLTAALYEDSSFSANSISSLYSCRARYLANFSGGSPDPLEMETDRRTVWEMQVAGWVNST